MIFGLTRPINMREHGLHRAERFDNNPVDIFDQFIYIVALFAQIAPRERERAFVSNIVIGRVFVKYEVLAIFVNCVVRQMHE